MVRSSIDQHIDASIRASKIDNDLLEAGLHVPRSCPTLRNNEGVPGMKFMSRAIGVHGDDLAFQDIHEFVEGIVARLQGSCFASPKSYLVTSKDARFVHRRHPVCAVKIAEGNAGG